MRNTITFFAVSRLRVCLLLWMVSFAFEIVFYSYESPCLWALWARDGPAAPRFENRCCTRHDGCIGTTEKRNIAVANSRTLLLYYNNYNTIKKLRFYTREAGGERVITARRRHTCAANMACLPRRISASRSDTFLMTSSKYLVQVPVRGHTNHSVWCPAGHLFQTRYNFSFSVFTGCP